MTIKKKRQTKPQVGLDERRTKLLPRIHENITSNQDPREVCVEVATVPQNPEKSLTSQTPTSLEPHQSNGDMVPRLKQWNDDKTSKKNSVKLTRPGLCPDQVK